MASSARAPTRPVSTGRTSARSSCATGARSRSTRGPRRAVDLLRLYLLGPALALLLHQRGFLVLHASAVSLDGGVVAFLGHSGHGKSTTAATLHARGAAIVADDVVAVDLGAPGGPAALPGFPLLKLWPDAVTALGENPRTCRACTRARRSGRESPTPRRRHRDPAAGLRPDRGRIAGTRAPQRARGGLRAAPAHLRRAGARAARLAELPRPVRAARRGSARSSPPATAAASRGSGSWPPSSRPTRARCPGALGR